MLKTVTVGEIRGQNYSKASIGHDRFCWVKEDFKFTIGLLHLLANITSPIINQQPLKYNYNEMPYHGKIPY